MQTLFVFILVSSILGVLYAHLLYPMVIILLARVISDTDGQVISPPRGDQALPSITVLIAAYNAEKHIAERIKNIRACDYPPERLRIVVASDGSTDRTSDVVQGFNDDRVTVLTFPDRRGKAATLIAAMDSVTSPVVVFTDATTRFDEQSLRRLTRHFDDPRLGLAAGRVTMVDEKGIQCESFYWKVENQVRKAESSLGITLGASGAIYAIRREMFVASSRPIINDDLVFPILIQLEHQCRLVLDHSARAYASSGGGIQAEFSRRQRIGIGAFQCLPILRGLLNWKNRGHAVAFASHKLMRWICPFMMVSAIVSNLMLLSDFRFQVFGLIQLTAYGVAIYGLTTSGQGLGFSLARSAASFLTMNAAIGFGICRWLVRPGTVVWNPTHRPSWQHVGTSSLMRNATEQRAA